MNFLHFIYKNKLVIALVVFSIGLIVRLLVIPYQVSEKIYLPVLPDGSVQLSTGQSIFHQGEPIAITLYNHYPTTVHLKDNCPSHPFHVYRSVANSWQLVNAQMQSPNCIYSRASLAIEPYSQVNINFSNWPYLFVKPGHYRIVATIVNSKTITYCDLQIVL